MGGGSEEDSGPEPELMKPGTCLEGEAAGLTDPRCGPRQFGPWCFQPEPDSKINPTVFAFLRGGTKADSERQSFVYLIVGMLLSFVSFCGFVPAIYMRLATGSWWRDPVSIRSMPLPSSIDGFVSAHGLVGMGWLGFMTVQLITGASNLGGNRKALRAVHAWMGMRSIPLALCFFATSGFTLLAGMIVEPVGVGYNSLFVRSLQAWSVFLSAVLFVWGLFHAMCRNIAAHKDCMLGSIVFALVPVGLPRFGRDVLQWAAGPACNVSSTPEFWFFWNSIYCIIGWPLVFVLARRFNSHPVFRSLLKFNVVCIIGLIVVFRPTLHLEQCIWDIVFGSQTEKALVAGESIL